LIKKQNKKKLKIIGLIFSITLVILTLKEVNINSVIKTISNTNIIYFFLSLIMMILVFVLRSIRWHSIIGHQINYKLVYESMMIGYFVHNIIPFRIGELIRAYFLNSKTKINISYLLGTIIAEKIIDGFSLVIIFLITTTFIKIENSFLLKTAQIIIIIIFVFFFIFYILHILKPKLKEKEKYLYIIENAIENKFNNIINKFYHGLHIFRNPKNFAYSLSMSILIWLLENLSIVFVLKAFYINIDNIFFHSIIPMLIINIGIIIPSGPGDIGMFEIAGKQGFGSLLNLETTLAISITLIFHLITLMPGFFIGGFYMFKYHIKINSNEEQNC